jgi:hypothetical protein
MLGSFQQITPDICEFQHSSNVRIPEYVTGFKDSRIHSGISPSSINTSAQSFQQLVGGIPPPPPQPTNSTSVFLHFRLTISTVFSIALCGGGVGRGARRGWGGPGWRTEYRGPGPPPSPGPYYMDVKLVKQSSVYIVIHSVIQGIQYT